MSWYFKSAFSSNTNEAIGYFKKEIKYQSIHRVLIIVSSFIRSIIFLCIIVFILESFPFDINQIDNDIDSSKTYNLISRISNLIIK